MNDRVIPDFFTWSDFYIYTKQKNIITTIDQHLIILNQIITLLI